MNTAIKPVPLDPQILQMASLTDLPSQTINLQPTQGFMGAQIQQLKTQSQPPVVNSQSLNITRFPLGGGSFQYRVQYAKPAGQSNYQSTNVILRSPSGSTEIVGSGNSNGPITFIVPQSNVPTAMSIQHVASNGPTSNPGFGSGAGRYLPYQKP
jgi:hypothetical protein